MRLKKFAQTATEYLIILAVVIIIALIVVGVLGGIPGIGGTAGQSADALAARTEQVGVESVVTTLYGTSFILRNNQATTIQLNNISIDGTSCFLPPSKSLGDGYVPTLPQKMKAGTTLEITCQGFRYTVDSDTDQPSDNVYYNYSTNFLGNLVSKSLGDPFIFDVSFDYTVTKTSANYISSNVTLQSTIGGGVGYS